MLWRCSGVDECVEPEAQKGDSQRTWWRGGGSPTRDGPPGKIRHAMRIRVITHCHWISVSSYLWHSASPAGSVLDLHTLLSDPIIPSENDSFDSMHHLCFYYYQCVLDSNVLLVTLPVMQCFTPFIFPFHNTVRPKEINCGNWCIRSNTTQIKCVCLVVDRHLLQGVSLSSALCVNRAEGMENGWMDGLSKKL